MSERTAEATTTVDEDGIRVEKSFTDDAFPVPAVMYELSSTREEPVRVRIVDRIPESFPMDRIGFHPEYESENWTAYKDHRVEFERVLDPGDGVETVFGIRDDDPELDGFLGTPVIEHVPIGEDIEDVLGTDTDAVREVLSGDRETLPGMEEPVAAAADGDETEESPAGSTVEGHSGEDDGSGTERDAADTGEGESESGERPSPRSVGNGGTAVVTPHTGEEHTEPETSNVEDEADDIEAEADGVGAEADDVEAETDDVEAETDDVGAEVTDVETEVTDDGLTAAEDEIDKPAETVSDTDLESGLAAALAAEIRSGEVDEADLATLRTELDVGVPRSVDVRIARLQSSVADIEAYADALAEFIDGEGTAREILDDLDAKVDSVEDGMAALDDRLDSAEAARTDLRGDLSAVDESVEAITADVDSVTDRVDGVSERVDGVETDVSTVGETVSGIETTVGAVTDDVDRIDEETAEIERSVDDLGDDIGTLYEEVDDAAAGVEATAERVEDVESRMGRFDEEFDDLWDDLAEVDTRITDIEDRLGEDLDDVASELDDINDHLEELEAFRERLNEAFGP